MLTWDFVSSLLRHLLTFGGGFLVAQNWISASEVEGIIGAIVTLTGLIWSAVQKYNASKKAA